MIGVCGEVECHDKTACCTGVPEADARTKKRDVAASRVVITRYLDDRHPIVAIRTGTDKGKWKGSMWVSGDLFPDLMLDIPRYVDG